MKSSWTLDKRGRQKTDGILDSCSAFGKAEGRSKDSTTIEAIMVARKHLLEWAETCVIAEFERRIGLGLPTENKQLLHKFIDGADHA